MPDAISPAVVANYGALVVFFAVGISLMCYYIFKLYPEDKRWQRENTQILTEQVALSRQALETSNMVIAQNSEAWRDSSASHLRLCERVGTLEDVITRHDERAETIAQDVAVVKSKVE